MHHAQSEELEAERVDSTQGGDSEDLLRVHHYRLIAHFLSGPPSEEDLRIAAALSAASDTPLGEAVADLALAAGGTNAAMEAEAYQTLFIGLGRGVFVPFGSYYLTGFLHEKPLARLRQDMVAFGIERSDDVSDPEDHIASVLEIMAGLAAGDFGAVSIADQRRFFESHVASWATHFFRDLSLDRTSAFYAAIGRLGTVFLEMEDRAFKLP